MSGEVSGLKRASERLGPFRIRELKAGCHSLPLGFTGEESL